MGLPNMSVIFKQKASTAVERSAKGIVGLIIRDDTDKTFTTKTYILAADVDKDSALYTPANLQIIKDCFVGNPNKIIVIRIDDTDGLIADALTIAGGLTLNWIGTAGIQADQDAVATWTKGKETKGKTYKSVVYKATVAPDSKQVVNLVNDKVTFIDSRGQVTGEQIIPTLLGYFAGLSLSMSATYLVIANLLSVVEAADNDVAIAAGKLVLINDESVVKIGSAVNSLITLNTTNTADMQKIAIVEGMNLMMDDIRSTFKDKFIGKYKNKYDNQVIFITAVNAYFKTLEGKDVLDNEYTNTCDVDVSAQRAALKTAGKTGIDSMTDVQIKNLTLGSNMYLAADVKMLDAIENMNFVVSMY